MTTKQYLSADWGRLCSVAGMPSKPLSFTRLFSPRFLPVVLIRLAWYFENHKMQIVGKIVSLINYQLFSIEVSPRMYIGPGLVIPHTFGIVLGAAEIGRNATIYHQVTIGAKCFDFHYDLEKRPTIGENVVLGSGCKILGKVTVGNNSIVGSNAVVTKDVPPGCIALGVPAVSRTIELNL